MTAPSPRRAKVTHIALNNLDGHGNYEYEHDDTTERLMIDSLFALQNKLNVVIDEVNQLRAAISEIGNKEEGK